MHFNQRINRREKYQVQILNISEKTNLQPFLLKLQLVLRHKQQINVHIAQSYLLLWFIASALA